MSPWNRYRRTMLNRLLLELDRAEAAAIACAEAEAAALGDDAPADALRAIAVHAAAMAPSLRALMPRRPPGTTRAIASMMRSLRRVVLVRIIDGDRAYRSVLGALHRNVDLVRLIRAVAVREQLTGIIHWCDDWLGARNTLLAHAGTAIAYFADEPHRALAVRPIAHLS